MLTQRQLFLSHLAQTSPFPLSLEIERAEGIYLYDIHGKKYTDLISGIAVSNLGHCHPKVVNAVKKQAETYMHLMVYGEYIQSPQVKLAELLSQHLPQQLNSTYFVNSGAEAIDGAMKLAKRVTARTGIISFKNAYHGSTHGPLSIMGDERLKQPFRPLLPDTHLIEFNNEDQLILITQKTAAVVVEMIQGEAGIILPLPNFLTKLQNRCRETGTLLIVDEIQTGFGRTGTLFAFEHYGIEPDILCLAKGMGGGMPIGAFISSKDMMSTLSNNPMLGHITTFGGHPVSCAAGLANLEEISSSKIYLNAIEKEKLFREYLKHSAIIEIRGKGLMLAVQFKDNAFNLKVILNCLSSGLITDWFLFNDSAMRIAPPLIITEQQIKDSCKIISEAIQKALIEG